MAQLDGSRHRGHFAQYDGGGYVLDLPRNRTAALLALETLEQQARISPASPCISPVSPLYLPCISPASPC